MAENEAGAVENEETPATEQTEPKRQPSLMELYMNGAYPSVLLLASQKLSAKPSVDAILFGALAKAQLAEGESESYKQACNAVNTAIAFAGQQGKQGVVELVAYMPLSFFLWYTIGCSDKALDRIEELGQAGNFVAAQNGMRHVNNGKLRDADQLNAMGLRLLEAMREFEVYDMGSLAMLKLMCHNIKQESMLVKGTTAFDKAAREFVFEATYATNDTFRTECEEMANAKAKNGKAKKTYNQQDVRVAWEMVPDLASLAGQMQ